MHAEANAIIHASRSEMTGATLYLVGKEARTGELVPDANSCSMCKRLIINARHLPGHRAQYPRYVYHHFGGGLGDP